MEDPGTWPRIRSLLDGALELPAEQREAFVEGKCPDDSVRRQVFSMLAAYAEDESLLDTPLWPAPQEGGVAPGDRLGPYLLTEKMGEGGMGAVYLARRADASFDKLVAIKLLKRGWTSAAEVRRFRIERQILADLEHPSIAKLLDGGSTPGGQPYLVMEYVEGEPLDLYCERRGLSVEARLALFLEICAAVQFAHQNLIVHRDLKPGNILVDRDGRPRLLDFGIAKILAPAGFAEQVEPTAAGIAPMTPQYASPEQVRGGAITTASDVYSLGVLLYRLLTGLPPYIFDQRDLKAVVDAVCHQEVPAPSSRLRRAAPQPAEAGPPPATAKRLRGDLDAIVAQALAKDPARRYATAEQLADDVRRHLARQPVRARGTAFSYRAGRFVSRHKLALGAAAAVFGVLVAAILALLFQQERLIEQRNAALRERNRSETVSSWLVELFTLPDPGRSLGEKVTARELLDKSRATVERELAGEPEVLATLLATLGETYGNLGQLKEAGDLFAAAIALHRHQGQPIAGSGGEKSEGRAIAVYRLADILSQQGRYPAARKLALSAYPGLLASLGEDHPEVIRCRTLLAYLDYQLGDWQAAAAGFEEARAAARAHGDAFLLSRVLDYAAELEQARGDLDRAEADYGEALALRRRLKGEDHPESVQLHSKLISLRARRQPAAAAVELRQVIARQRNLYGGGPHPLLAVTLNNLGLLVLDEGRVAEAEALFEEALAMARTVYGRSHPTVAAILNNLGQAASQRGDLAAAEEAYQEAMAVSLEEKGERDPAYALMASNLGMAKMARGALDEAGALFERALALTRETVGAEHPQNLAILNNLGQRAMAEQRTGDARELYRQAAAVGRRPDGGSLPELPTVLLNLGEVEFKLGLTEEARATFEETAKLAGGSLVGVHAAAYLARLELDRGRPAPALAWAERALPALERAGAGEEGWVMSVRRSRGRALLALGRHEAAESDFRWRVETLERNGAPADKLALARQELEAAADALAAGRAEPAEGGAKP